MICMKSLKYNALLRFLDKKEGGRVNPPMSGYRPHIKVDNYHTSCIITSETDEVFSFGTDHDVLIELMYEPVESTPIKSGFNIGIYEGNRLVGHGYMK